MRQRIALMGGKYSLVRDGGTLKALRHGKEWRDLTGDHMVAELLNIATTSKASMCVECGGLIAPLSDDTVSPDVLVRDMCPHCDAVDPKVIPAITVESG